MAETLQLRGGLQGQVVHLGGGAAPDPLGHHRDVEPGLARSGDVADRREREVAVDLLHLAVERRRVTHRPGEHPVGHDPDRHLPHHLVLRQTVARRLEPDQPVDGRRDPDRPATVVGVRDRYDAGGDHRRGPRRRRPRRAIEVPRAAHRPQAGVLGRGVETELRQLGLAQRQQARSRGTSARSRRPPPGAAAPTRPCRAAWACRRRRRCPSRTSVRRRRTRPGGRRTPGGPARTRRARCR